MEVRETGAPGWAEVVFEDLPARVLIKVGRQGDRWVITDLVVHGETLTASLWKSLPLGRFEALINQYGIGEKLAGQDYSGYPENARKAFEAGSARLELEQVETGLDAYWRKKLPRPPISREHLPRSPLQRPDGRDPEAFYRKVAEVYNNLVSETSAPAKVMAEEAGVPTTTVHRWIFEARRRGHLPPARKGRAG